MTIEAHFELAYEGFTFEVDTQLPSRGVTGLFGPSGCGKTTFLRCVAGLTRPTRGRLVVDGETWQDDTIFVPTHRRSLGYVFQEASLFEHLTVQRNLDYGLTRALGRAGARPEAGDRIVDLLGIRPLLSRKPAGLSGGERQRVAIARALLTQPRILLMDEPLSALDVARKAEFLPYLERMHAELDIPVLYVSHAPDEIARLADHLVVLDAGRIAASGPLSDVMSRLDLPVRLGEDTGVVLAARVTERDPRWHLAQVEYPGGSLWVRDFGHPVGEAVRVRILARDVSIARTLQRDSSIMNGVPCRVEAIGEESHPALALVRMRCGASSILARITKRSLAQLELQVGDDVWAQIKAAALLT
jgi:molybdate transport system ATP-binding protein